jgi:hypothetical protein
MEGLLLRKQVMDSANKKSSHRVWRSFFVVLKGSELFFYKPLNGNNPDQKCVETFHIRHAVSVFVQNYKKRSNLFSLTLYNGAVHYFEAESEKLQNTWVRYLNYMSALHSAPTMPAPIGSIVDEFFVPVMPVYPTNFDKVFSIK